MTMIVRGIPILLVACTAMASTVSAQDAASIAGPSKKRFFLGGHLSLTTGGLNSHDAGWTGRGSGSDRELHLTARGGVRIRPPLYLEGLIAFHTAAGEHHGEIPLIPIGEFTRTSTQHLTQYPHASVLGRLVAEPGAHNTPFRPRIFAGTGLIIGSWIPVLDLGVGISSGGERGRLILEASHHWVSDSYEILRQRYRNDGPGYNPIFLREETEARVARARMLVVNLGFQHFL